MDFGLVFFSNARANCITRSLHISFSISPPSCLGKFLGSPNPYLLMLLKGCRACGIGVQEPFSAVSSVAAHRTNLCLRCVPLPSCTSGSGFEGLSIAVVIGR